MHQSVVHQCTSSVPPVAKEELEPVGRVTVRGTGHRTVTSPYNNTIHDDDDDDDDDDEYDDNDDDDGDDGDDGDDDDRSQEISWS